jgi:calcineurin-like phosphoesterase family protein
MTTFYTSDLHFNHTNIIKYCKRPFADVHEMNAALIRNWNERVKTDDVVYVLGDFAFLRRQPENALLALTSQLHGWKVLVTGNHDPKDCMYLIEQGFHETFNGDPRTRGGLLMDDALLLHQPPTDLEWLAAKTVNPQLKYVFCGHVHEKWARRGDFINVGVDVRGYRPVTREELLQ